MKATTAGRTYETWVVALWIDNEPDTYEMRREWARDIKETVTAQSAFGSSAHIFTDRQAQVSAMADQIKEYVDNENPQEIASLWSDLLSAAISEVDWREIAENWLDEES